MIYGCLLLLYIYIITQNASLLLLNVCFYVLLVRKMINILCNGVAVFDIFISLFQFIHLQSHGRALLLNKSTHTMARHSEALRFTHIPICLYCSTFGNTKRVVIVLRFASLCIKTISGRDRCRFSCFPLRKISSFEYTSTAVKFSHIQS